MVRINSCEGDNNVGGSWYEGLPGARYILVVVAGWIPDLVRGKLRPSGRGGCQQPPVDLVFQ